MTGRAIRSEQGIDAPRVDWSRVSYVAYQVRQHYRYTYTGPVADLKHRLVVVPPDRHGDQRLLDFDLDVRGVRGYRSVSWDVDDFGNRVCWVRAERIDHAVDFEARYRVERYAENPDSGTSTNSSLRPYLEPTSMTAPDERMFAAARQIGAETTSPLARADRANEWAADSITYRFGVTGVQTPAAMALHLGRGVCQDYAHILLTVLRLLAVPARYVSGHLLGEGAPHAWVEALFEDPSAPDGLRVVAYDPTHRRRSGLNYIMVAVGRDFADVTPTSGRFSGPHQGKLSSTKRAEIVEVRERPGGAQEDAA